MAVIKNDRDNALQVRGADGRVMNPLVTISITSTAPANTPYFTFVENSTTVLPATITLTAMATGSGSYTNPIYAWYYSTQTDPVTWISLGVTTNTLTISNSQFATELGTTNTNINYKVVVSQAGWSTSSVTTSIEGARTATSQPAVLMSRDSFVLPVALSGTIDYTNTNTDIIVSINNINLPYDSTNSQPSSFTVVANASTSPSISVGTPTTATTVVTGDTRRYPNVSALSSVTSTATITYTITVRDINSKVYTITKVQSYAASVAGAASIILQVSADSPVFVRDGITNNIVRPSVITLMANKTNTSNTVTWTTTPSIALYSSATGGTVTSTGDIVYLRSADFAANTFVSITASIFADGVSDTTGISTVRNGSAAILAVLTNSSVSLPTIGTGAVSSYSGSGTDIEVYEGGTLCTITAVTATANGITAGSITGLNSTVVTVANSTNMTATSTATIKYDITITRGDGSSYVATNTQNIFKSLAGASGQSARRAYVVTTSATAPGIPTAGSGDVPPTNTVTSQVVAWSFSATSGLTNGQYMYQSDGVHTDGGDTIWGNPYLSYFKVGQLSAIVANLGNVIIDTAGSLVTTGKTFSNTTNGVFLGYDSGAYKFAVGASNGPGAYWDGSSFIITNNTGAPVFTTSGSGTFINNTITLNSANSLIVGNTTSGVYLGTGGLTAKHGGVTTLSVGSDGTAVFSGSVNTGAFTGYGWPTTGTGSHLSSAGLLIGNGNTSKYFQVTGDGNIYAPNFSIVNGTMTISAVNVINTLNIGGGAVTETYLAYGSSTATYTVTIPSGQTWQITAIGSMILSTYYSTVITANGTPIGATRPGPAGNTYYTTSGGATAVSSTSGSISTIGTAAFSGPTTVTILLQGYYYDPDIPGNVNGGSDAQLMILATKR